jgi:Zn-dependent protease with chaperone function
MVRKQVDIQAIANDVAGRHVRISWSAHKQIKRKHAAYSPIQHRILVSTAYQEAPEPVVRCLIAHELGHMEDTLDHLLRYFCIATILAAFSALFIHCHWFDWVGLACFVFAVVGGIVYLFINWEARADRWAEKTVGKDLYWSTKATIFELADR